MKHLFQCPVVTVIIIFLRMLITDLVWADLVERKTENILALELQSKQIEIIYFHELWTRII